MSSFLGKADSGNPIMHFTSDTKSIADMKSGPGPTTLFHSDLPYVFVRERWKLTSYTGWAGGRKFALPSDLRTFKSNNPNLAFLIIVEQSDGSKAIMDPCLHVSYYYWMNQTNVGNQFLVADVLSAINGTDYQYAFTDDDSQLSSITRQPSLGALTFRTWDSNDTSITIFRAPFGECYIPSGYVQGQVDYQLLTWDYNNRGGKNLLSVGNDCVSIEIVFLNITNSPTTFDRQPNFNSSSAITVSRDTFNVGGFDLLNFTPTLSRGTYNTGSTITPYYGNLVGGKPNFISLTDFDMGYVTTGNQVTKNGTPVLEIPVASQPSDTLEIDFKQKYIKKGGKTIFNASTASQGLRVIGTKEIEFTLDSGNIGEYSNTHAVLASTQTGSYTETPTSNTIYLMSAVFNGVDILNSSIIGVGDNVILATSLYWRYEQGVAYQYSMAPQFYLNITANGAITPKVYKYSSNYINIGGNVVSVGFGSIKVRLIALAA